MEKRNCTGAYDRGQSKLLKQHSVLWNGCLGQWDARDFVGIPTLWCLYTTLYQFVWESLCVHMTLYGSRAGPCVLCAVLCCVMLCCVVLCFVLCCVVVWCVVLCCVVLCVVLCCVCELHWLCVRPRPRPRPRARARVCRIKSHSKTTLSRYEGFHMEMLPFRAWFYYTPIAMLHVVRDSITQ